MKHRPAEWLLIAALCLAVGAGVVTLGVFYHDTQRAHYRTNAQREIAAVADLKAGELTLWRKSRLADANTLFKNPAFSSLVRRCFERPNDLPLQEELRTWVGKYRDNYQYDRVLLHNAATNKWTIYSDDKTPISSVAIQMAREVEQSKQLIFSAFAWNEYSKKIYLRIFIPILDEQAGGRAIGTLMLRIDPETYLYPFIQRWPTPSKTAESLLVRREGDEVVFLNDLRFRKNAALTLRFPLTRAEIPAVKAALGQTGDVDGIDYRGMPVLATVRAIPNSSWRLIAKIDADEVYAPMRERFWMTLSLVCAVLVAFSTTIGLFWRRQQARLLREAADASRKSESRLRAILDTTPFPIALVDTQDNEVDFWSRSALTLFGHTAPTAAEWYQIAYPDPDYRREVIDHWKSQLETARTSPQTIKTGEYRVTCRDGSVRVCELYAAFLEDRLVVTFNDITDRKQAEEHIRTLNAELEQRVAQRTEELLAANRELEAFSYSVSHDLRAPLRHVQGYVDMLAREAEGRLSENGLRYLKTIANASQEMGTLIDDLLEFSRTGRAEMLDATVDLDSLVLDVLRDLEHATRERNIVWKIAPLPTVQGDPAMLKLVLTNLLDNAVKFTRPRDPAEIEIGCDGMEGERVILFVRDNGVGFDPQYSHKLFGVFQRLHRSDEFPGTGIGLANVRRIIARQGGRTWAEGTLNRGATFFFTLRQPPLTNPVNCKKGPGHE